MPRLLLVWCVLHVLLAWASGASAYPGMIRHGQPNCSQCHADPSGGELLNDFGRLQGEQVLAMQYGDGSDGESGEEPEMGPLWNLYSPPEWLLLGGAYRHALYAQFGDVEKVRQFPMMADVYGQVAVGALRAGASVGLARVPPGSPHARPAQVTHNQGDEWNMISRWHWVGAELGGTTLIRGGRLNQPFGLRMPEHTAWVREATRTDRESDQQHGIAIAHTSYRIRGELMAILGNYQINPDRFRERGYSLSLEGGLSNRATLGVTSKLTRAEADLPTLEEAPTTRQAHGVFSRWSPDPMVVVLAEMDLLLASRRDFGYVGFVQLDVEPVRGLHLFLTGEVLDAGFVQRLDTLAPSGLDRAPGVGLPKTGGWVSAAWYFLPQFELRVDAIARYDDPFSLLAQLHLYL